MEKNKKIEVIAVICGSCTVLGVIATILCIRKGKKFTKSLRRKIIEVLS